MVKNQCSKGTMVKNQCSEGTMVKNQCSEGDLGFAVLNPGVQWGSGQVRSGQVRSGSSDLE